jgi:hypothetical protein
MSNYYYCTDCEYINIKMVPGVSGSAVKELSCPARFNPREGKWLPVHGVNPHECPRNENFMRIQKQADERRLR